MDQDNGDEKSAGLHVRINNHLVCRNCSQILLPNNFILLWNREFHVFQYAFHKTSPRHTYLIEFIEDFNLAQEKRCVTYIVIQHDIKEPYDMINACTLLQQRNLRFELRKHLQLIEKPI